MRILLVLCLAATCGAADLRFKAVGGGEFQFDTGVLRGTLRAGGKSLGLTSVVHVPTGLPLTWFNGIFTHYRVFTANQRYGGGAYLWPSVATQREDGSVEVRWPVTPDRPFEMWAVYRWTASDTLDLETGVQAHAPLVNFESFLSSYFAPQFVNSLVYARQGKRPAFVSAEKAQGVWQMFPRDEAALALIRDGRWKILPSPVDWAIQPPIERPLGMRRDPASGITVLLMAPPQDCFAVSTPHQTENHRSLYLSLFGRTIQAGESARARSRMVVAVSPSQKRELKIYKAYSAGGR